MAIDGTRRCLGLVAAVVLVVAAASSGALSSATAAQSGLSATRDIHSTELQPEGVTLVTVNVTVGANVSRLTINESVAPAVNRTSLRALKVDGIGRSPNATTQTPTEFEVVLGNVDAGSTVELIYAVFLPANASDGTTYEFTGRVRSTAGTTFVGGDGNVTVEVPPPAVADRSISDRRPAAGSTTTVTVEVTAEERLDSLTLRESFAPPTAGARVRGATINGSLVSPDRTAGSNDSAVAAFGALDDGAVVRVDYDLSIPADAAIGTTYRINGTVDTSNGTVPVTGVDTIRVAPSVAGYANANGRIDTAGLRSAIADWVNGVLPTRLLREVISAWVSGSAVSR